MQYIVFGATGYIGSYIYQQLKKEGYSVIGTTRKKGYGNELILYDIQKSNISAITSMFQGNDKTAVICIAESNINRCYEDYDRAYDINVIKTKKLVGHLLDKGFYVIYFSSDNVFDGVSGNYTEESPVNPINQYGMMKAEMEQYLLCKAPDSCILRISKVVSMSIVKQNVFNEWFRDISNGYIRCIKGNYLSFVCVDDIYHACLIAAQKKLHGIYNIAGDMAYSRAELAKKFYDRLGGCVDIRECDAKEFALKDGRPLNLRMSNLKFKGETGYRFLDMDTAIEGFAREVKEQE